MKIKICGLYREQDIDFVNAAQPDYIGFVFAKSKRQVGFEKAQGLRSKLAENIIPVGVFVNTEAPVIVSLYKNGIINIAQLHGGEDESYIQNLKELCAIPVIKALRAGTAHDARWNTSQTAADYLLFDSGSGSGACFDWNILQALKIEAAPLPPWFLAGGINPENIEDAIRQNPWCIDISSGAETNGVKDKEKIFKLVQAVRENSRQRLV